MDAEPILNEDSGATRGDGEIVAVIRRLVPRPPTPYVADPGTRMGLVVDVETTGLRPKRADGSAGGIGAEADEIIQFAAVPFTYRPTDGRLLAVHEPLHALNQPRRPIPPAITALTGIDDAMVAGRTLPLDEIDALVSRADCIFAHNAAFDRRFLEAVAGVFERKPWACTIEDANWAEEGLESGKLVFVAAMGFGFAYPAHDAIADCLAVVEILSRAMPGSGIGVLAKVLASARRGRDRVRVESDFAARHALKARGYRWDPGSDGGPKCWYMDTVNGAARDSELAFLADLSAMHGLRCDARVQRLDALDRFSDRG